MIVTKLITKKLIIDAIKTEPLAGGSWLDDYERLLSCNVCVVGAVLRKVSFFKWAKQHNINPSTIAWNICGSNVTGSDDPDEAIVTGQYLTALSRKFESLVEEPDHISGFKPVTQAIRKELIQWVKENLPEQFEVSYQHKGE